MKFSQSFCLILVSLLFINTFASDCNPGKGANLLYRTNIFRRALKGLAQDVYVDYPKNGDTTNVEIVDFCVYDHDPNLFGTQAVYAYGSDDDLDRKVAKATIILRSQESRGINSTIEFYGFKSAVL